jgi:hypothetical protein
VKARLVLSLVVAGVAALVLTLSGAGAVEVTQAVIPKVNIDPGGGLTVLSGTSGPPNYLMDLGNLGPGSIGTTTLILGVTANAEWILAVSKSKDLECTTPEDPGYGLSVPSSAFTFTSNGLAGAIYVTSATEFGTAGIPANVATDGSPCSSLEVNVVYDLAVPGDQPAGYYTAPQHTYTLIVGS